MHITSEIVIPHNKAIVWQALTNFSNYPNWNLFINSIIGLPKIGKKIIATVRYNKVIKLKFSAKIIEVKPQCSLRWEGIFIFKKLFCSEHYLTLEEIAPNSTRLIQGEIYNGILPPILKFLIKRNDIGFQLMNQNLKNYLEVEQKIHST